MRLVETFEKYLNDNKDRWGIIKLTNHQLSKEMGCSTSCILKMLAELEHHKKIERLTIVKGGFNIKKERLIKVTR